jgi:hypothetical protein
VTPCQQRFSAWSRWARREMALLGPKVGQEKQIGQLWLIIDEMMRRLAKAEVEPPAISQGAQGGKDDRD